MGPQEKVAAKQSGREEGRQEAAASPPRAHSLERDQAQTTAERGGSRPGPGSPAARLPGSPAPLPADAAPPAPADARGLGQPLTASG